MKKKDARHIFDSKSILSSAFDYRVLKFNVIIFYPLAAESLLAAKLLLAAIAFLDTVVDTNLVHLAHIAVDLQLVCIVAVDMDIHFD